MLRPHPGPHRGPRRPAPRGTQASGPHPAARGSPVLPVAPVPCPKWQRDACPRGTGGVSCTRVCPCPCQDRAPAPRSCCSWAAGMRQPVRGTRQSGRVAPPAAHACAHTSPPTPVQPCVCTRVRTAPMSPEPTRGYEGVQLLPPGCSTRGVGGAGRGKGWGGGRGDGRSGRGEKWGNGRGDGRRSGRGFPMHQGLLGSAHFAKHRPFL